MNEAHGMRRRHFPVRFSQDLYDSLCRLEMSLSQGSIKENSVKPNRETPLSVTRYTPLTRSYTKTNHTETAERVES